MKRKSLSLSFDIVQAYGGELVVKSAEGKDFLLDEIILDTEFTKKTQSSQRIKGLIFKTKTRKQSKKTIFINTLGAKLLGNAPK